MNEYVVDSVPESKGSPGPSRRSRRENETPTPEKINQQTEHTKQNETEHIKIRRINTQTRIVDVSIAMQRKVTQNQTTLRKGRTKRLNKLIWVGPPVQ